MIERFVTAFCQACKATHRILSTDKSAKCPGCEGPLLGVQRGPADTEIQKTIFEQQERDRTI